jgi:hypothetical protein
VGRPPVAESRRGSAVLRHVRALLALLAAGTVSAGLYQFRVGRSEQYAWWLVAAGLVLAALGLSRIDPAPSPGPPRVPAGARRLGIGALLVLLGTGLWIWSTGRIYLNWQAGFDAAWSGWLASTVLLGIGLDLAWGRWPRDSGRRWPAWSIGVAVLLLAIAALYRLGNIKTFPGEAAITQIEDLQAGNMGDFYLHGDRLRWEYLGSTWLSALGIWWGGPSQMAMRVPFAVVSSLKAVPIFIWLRLSVGWVGALVGTALFAVSSWDTVLSRAPNNHHALIVAIVFALLAGPARRGRPSAYAWIGFLGGYILFQYIAYRPLAVFGLMGAAIWSFGDHSVGRVRRLLRPAMIAAMIASMLLPLFATRLHNAYLRQEYINGWNRAHGIRDYYDPTATWSQALNRRVRRAADAARLFLVRGDRSPARNLADQPPLIDPATSILLLLGIACAAVHLLQPLLGLPLFAFAVTFCGALILTGNFDVGRIGGATPYVYVLAGIGAAGFAEALRNAWGKTGRALSALLLAAAVAFSAFWCTNFLFELWGSPRVRLALRNNLAYITIWLRDHARPDERVVGIAPGYTNAITGQDGAWLRGRDIPGAIDWNIEGALETWRREQGNVLFFVFAGPETEDTTAFLRWLLPSLHFDLDRDPLPAAKGDVAYMHTVGSPPRLNGALARWNCVGVEADYRLMGAGPDEVTKQLTRSVPLMGRSAWPRQLVQAVYRANPRPSAVRVDFESPFVVRKEGQYSFSLETYAANATLFVDGKQIDGRAQSSTTLAAGPHRIRLEGQYAPIPSLAVIRLLWSGPDSNGKRELMPFYRLVPPGPGCENAAPAAP